MSSLKTETPKYRLIYYPLRGRGELVRLLFAHLQISYEDARIDPSDWATSKPDSPFGALPILEFLDTGKKLSSSTAIVRLFAERNGMAGSDDIENAELFSIVDAAADAWFQIYPAVYREKDEERKAVLVKKLHEEYLPSHIAKFEHRAKQNNNKDGWIFGQKFTYADIATYMLFDYIVSNLPGALENYPTLAKQRESVHNLKNIAQWLKERPETWI